MTYYVTLDTDGWITRIECYQSYLKDITLKYIFYVIVYDLISYIPIYANASIYGQVLLFYPKLSENVIIIVLRDRLIW